MKLGPNRTAFVKSGKNAMTENYDFTPKFLLGALLRFTVGTIGYSSPYFLLALLLTNLKLTIYCSSNSIWCKRFFTLNIIQTYLFTFFRKCNRSWFKEKPYWILQLQKLSSSYFSNSKIIEKIVGGMEA